MKKILYSIVTLIFYSLVFGQVGINTSDPKATLDINGSLANRESIVSIASNAVTITPNMSQYRIIGTATADFTITVGAASIEGQRLVIFNDTTGGYAGKLGNMNITNGFAVEFIYSNGAWHSTAFNSSIVSVYSSQVKIPPHRDATNNSGVADFTNHSNTDYDVNNWHVISKTSTAAATGYPAKMTIVYEYQGTPFSLNKIYPIYTAGNNTSFPDTFLVNFINISNSTGKTRMTVAVNRMDNFTVSTTSTSANWSGTFLINFLLINSSL
jgi:hypothetical protein